MHRQLLAAALLIAAALPLGFAGGCDPGEVVRQAQQADQRQVLMQHLKDVGAAYLRYHDAHWQNSGGAGAPESWEHLQESGLSSEARQKLEQAGYKLVLGVELPQATIGTSNFMLAYPANPTGDQILVGMMDGSARVVDSTEFADLLAQQQPLLSQAVVIEPPAGAAVPAATSGNPNVPPPPPSSGP